jgi:hypothetical protein
MIYELIVGPFRYVSTIVIVSLTHSNTIGINNAEYDVLS